MKKLPASDLRHVKAAEGWLELDNHLATNAELEKIAPASRLHPDVLEIRWQIYAKEERWDFCRFIAMAMTQTVPERADGWIRLAQATRRATGSGIPESQAILFSVVGKFPRVPLISYKLACYECRLGNTKVAKQWLKRSFEIGDAKQLKLKALGDPSLKPLWAGLAKL